MTVYATRLVNGTDTRERLRRADAMHVFPSGPGMARGGFRNDGGGVVTVNAGTMTVDVSPFTAWVDGGVSDAQGGYTFVSDATETLTLTAGHASLERTDVVIAEVRDTNHDGSGSTDARVRILQGTPGSGTPALPTNALALRNITVPAGLSAGTGGLTSGNLSTDRRTYTTGLGGVLTVASQAERDALPAIAGSMVYRSDLDRLETRSTAGWEPVSADEVALWRPVANAMTFTDQTTYAVMSNATERTAMTAQFTKAAANTKLQVSISATIGMVSGAVQAILLGVRIGGTDYDVARGVGMGANTYTTLAASRPITGLAAGAVTLEPVFKASGTSSFSFSNTYTTVSLSVREIR